MNRHTKEGNPFTFNIGRIPVKEQSGRQSFWHCMLPEHVSGFGVGNKYLSRYMYVLFVYCEHMQCSYRRCIEAYIRDRPYERKTCHLSF